jgi:putative ABC transport system permease protein
VVNRRLAQRFWPGESALERRLRVAGADGVDTYRVIGVAPDLVYEELGEETDQSRLIVYVPYARAGWRTMALMVRAERKPASVIAPMRTAVREIDPFLAPYDVLTMTRRRVVTMWGERFLARTFAAFGVAALLLACIGIYGLTAYTAAERRRELGIRLAIGARPADIVNLLVRRGALLAVIGCGIGLPFSIAASYALAGLLFGIAPWDAIAWIVAPVALAAAVFLSSVLPAHRASRLDPARALQD